MAKRAEEERKEDLGQGDKEKKTTKGKKSFLYERHDFTDEGKREKRM